MQYFYKFVGGPLDGRREPAIMGQGYATINARQLQDTNPDLWGVYDYSESQIDGDSTERIFRYRKSCSCDEATRILATNHTVWRD